jgi:transposase
VRSGARRQEVCPCRGTGTPAGWIAAPELRLLYRHRDPARAAEAFCRCLNFYADSPVPELPRLARTLDSWRGEILAPFTGAGMANGPTEAISLLIKKVKRVGRGFRNSRQLPRRPALHAASAGGLLRPPR